ncbi:phosphoribosyltransferase domain-containing protein [Aquipuribacter hungaricus]|uniref:Phosphoribosyltransferase domain-containing protein n=1 Tax=Aquipuribacter hungaricus TaxID=545624 RepID=A0ABV7WGF7_9MICO
MSAPAGLRPGAVPGPPAPAQGAPAGWTGAWVSAALGVAVEPVPGGPVADVRLLTGLALRRNPRRPHLLVSTVLGKHVPTDPRLVRSAARLLGLLVADQLAGEEPPTDLDGAAALLVDALDPAGEPSEALLERLDAAVASLVAGAPPVGAAVLGYAETATGLSHEVAEVLRAAHLHSTRRRVPGAAAAAGFDEEHSHATGHLLLPDADVLAGLLGEAPLVLVDDELSTGRTARNTLRALHALRPRDRYVVAALVDVRGPDDVAATEALAVELGARVDVVILARGRVRLPDDAGPRAADLVAAHDLRAHEPQPDGGPGGAGTGDVRDLGAAGWPAGVRETARHGLLPGAAAAFDDAARTVAATVSDALRTARPDGAGRVVVLGDEELMAAPARVAWHLRAALRAAGDGTAAVLTSTTTRSPVAVLPDPGYAVRGSLAFSSHDAPLAEPGPRWAYNLTTRVADDGPAAGPGRQRGTADVLVLVTDEAGDTDELRAPGGLLDRLAGAAGTVVLVRLPTDPPAATATVRQPPGTVLRGPAFGSYAAEDVGWLLEDLSHVALEAPTAHREAAVQAGTAHYAESLPVEYQPDAGYQQLFARSLATSAARVARAVAVVAELVLAERGEDVVLASLARAGTPVGILLRRWAALRHGLDLPHYALSIVRGRGVDEVALDHLRAHHDPRQVVFVDGWTGKGAIVRELRAAVEAYSVSRGLAPGEGFDPDLVVLADPGRCVTTFGTRDDFLVPSACLNSTVSGLVSRTVLNDAYLRPGGFHGAKHYAALAPQDVSTVFVDTVVACFDEVAGGVAADVAAVRAGDRTPTFEGWRAVEAVGRAHGMQDVNLVKPGVGETTRVLLRRVPWKVLVRPGAAADLEHVLYLAADRGVPVEEVPGLPYSCIGLISPQSVGTRGEG